MIIENSGGAFILELGFNDSIRLFDMSNTVSEIVIVLSMLSHSSGTGVRLTLNCVVISG